MKTGLFITLLSITILMGSAAAQAQDNDYAYYQRKAIEAYQNKDYQGFLDYTKKGLELNPNSTSMMYNLACGYALTGKDKQAVATLQKLAKMGVDYGAAQDPDFESLRNRQDFKQLLKTYEKMEIPINTSTLQYTIPQLDLLPEGISYDPRARRFFIGSMRFGVIYALDSNNDFYEFCRLENEIPLAAVGLEVDTIRNLLWAVGSSFNYRLGFEADDEGTSGVFGFDLQDGKLVKKLMYPGKPPRFGFNDLTVSSAGDIYVTGAEVFVFPAGGENPQPLISSEYMINSNGITLSPDQKTLFVADYVQGIMAYNLETGDHQWLEYPDTITLYGVDGMYFYDNSLIAIQNSFRPWRAVRFFLNEGMDSVTGIQIFERGNPFVAEAFTGTIVGNEFYYVGHGNNPASYPDYIPNVIRRDIGETMILKTSLKENQ